MQEEITEHSKKIYKTVKNTEHTFGEKVKEIIVEICIIVFAVTISIWFHSMSEKSHQREEAKEFLTDLNQDLSQDILLMETYSTRLKSFNKNLEIVNQYKSNYEELKKIKINPLPPFINRETSTGDYDGFKSSGKIGYIENKKLKSSILKYYQQNMLRLANAEKFFGNLSVETSLRVTDKGMESVIDDSNITRLNILGGMSTEIVQVYDQQIKAAKEIIKEIEKETK
ncbi:hypothetical protein [Flavobacterium sp. LC2016-12]|uniref:hypothetical protein n=1 Tax=Flavobacterium sp. LC2016-12 TaxID=2783794 RepID=UPI00188A4FCF|nr:hypothetical protein [Flavobacterium sp. LC2016-12]MBF4466805.1 hypothetical protein [Flavobacterium sp. LC2016-12]